MPSNVVATVMFTGVADDMNHVATELDQLALVPGLSNVYLTSTTKGTTPGSSASSTSTSSSAAGGEGVQFTASANITNSVLSHRYDNLTGGSTVKALGRTQSIVIAVVLALVVLAGGYLGLVKPAKKTVTDLKIAGAGAGERQFLGAAAGLGPEGPSPSSYQRKRLSSPRSRPRCRTRCSCQTCCASWWWRLTSRAST